MDAMVRLFQSEVLYFLIGMLLINLAAIAIIYFKRAPNVIVGLAFFFAFIAALMRFGRRGSVWALLGAGLAGGVALFFYLRGYLGAGDVKLLAATGTLLGPIQIFYALFIAILVLLLVDVASIKWHSRRAAKPLIAAPMQIAERAVSSPFLRIPSGVAIVLGANLSFGLRHWLA